MVQNAQQAKASQNGVPYQRHRPEHTLLYQVVDQYCPAFVDRLAAEGKSLPGYVQREFEEFLKCGLLEHDFFAGTLRELPF